MNRTARACKRVRLVISEEIQLAKEGDGRAGAGMRTHGGFQLNFQSCQNGAPVPGAASGL